MKRTPLRHILRPRESTGHSELDVLSVYREHGVIPKDSRTDNYNKTPDDLSRYQRVEPGDLVVNKMKAWSGSVGVSKYRGIVSPDYLVCQVSSKVDPRFLHHWLRSRPAIAEMRARSRGIRPNQERLYWDDLAGIQIDLPSRGEQRRIADLLDDQVTCLDAVMSARLQQQDLIEHRFGSLWAERVLALDGPDQWVPLRRFLVSITDGPFGSSLTSAHYASDGARVIRLGNLGTACFRPDDEAYIPMSYYEQLRDHAVAPGDLLVAGLGDDKHPLGRACIVPDDLGPAIVKADCFRLRLDEATVSHSYAAWALSSPPVTAETQLISRGATRARINTAIARDLRIPIPAPEVQADFVRQMSQERAVADAAEQALTRSLTLLQERKQALITAAVTGQLDVTTARRVA